MNKNQRQAILLLGFMTLLSAVFIYLFVHGPGAEERSVIPDIDMEMPDVTDSDNQTLEDTETEEDENDNIPLIGTIIEGWKQLLEDLTAFS